MIYMKVGNDMKKTLGFIMFLIAAFFVYFSEEEPVNNKQKVEMKQTEETTQVNATDKLEIHFIDVGQADSILINNNNKYMLIDAGNNEDGEKLVTYFKSLGIEEFEYVIGTHAHEDHIGGMDNIIDNFGIKTFYMPDVLTTTRTFEEVLDSLENKSIAFETPEINAAFSLENAKLNVLHVGNDDKDLNDTSIVLKMFYGNNKFLFMGDATTKVEEKILNKDLSSDLLKVGNHGSYYSTSQDFLNKVNSKYAIIEVGANNTYNHPTQSVIEKFNKKGIKIYRTDKDGTIIATSDGTNISFETKKTDTNG